MEGVFETVLGGMSGGGGGVGDYVLFVFTSFP